MSKRDKQICSGKRVAQTWSATKEPSSWQKVKNFAKATAKHVASKGAKSSPEEQKRREAICKSCTQYYDSKRQICKHKNCGCTVKRKAAWLSQSCPVGKWDQKQSAQIEHFTPKLTIGMATYDDFDGVCYSVQCLRMFHPEIANDAEIIVVDNNPSSKQGEATQGFCKSVGVKYVAYTDKTGSCPPRQKLFEIAAGDYVLCMDSHVFFPKGALECLVDYYKRNPDTKDLLHGPLLAHGLTRVAATHMEPKWRNQMFGTWGIDTRGIVADQEPFEIPQHGLGIFSCKKSAWLGFHEDFSGFSGGEGYIHEKFRKSGAKVLCLPGFRWWHKFTRPSGVPYRLATEDKIKNHLIGWHSIGMDLSPIFDHFVNGVGTKNNKPVVSEARMKELCKQVNVPCGDMPEPKASGLIIGPSSYGSFQMRGAPLVKATGWENQNSRGKVILNGTRDVCLAVKCDIPPVVLRGCSKIVFDPMDKWFSDARKARMDPVAYWKSEYERNPWTDIIATSPSCADAMQSAAAHTTVHLVPHAPDPRIEAGWYDPNGPIVYAGARYFIERYYSQIREAAKLLGREVFFDHDHHAWKSLKGASAVLSLRLPPTNSALNKQCKPQVKVANAAAAGIPVLSTDCPAATSLYGDITTITVEDCENPKKIADAIARAHAVKPAMSHIEWLKAMEGLL
jgi:hypothetical protein